MDRPKGGIDFAHSIRHTARASALALPVTQRLVPLPSLSPHPGCAVGPSLSIRLGLSQFRDPSLALRIIILIQPFQFLLLVCETPALCNEPATVVALASESLQRCERDPLLQQQWRAAAATALISRVSTDLLAGNSESKSSAGSLIFLNTRPVLSTTRP